MKARGPEQARAALALTPARAKGATTPPGRTGRHRPDGGIPARRVGAIGPRISTPPTNGNPPLLGCRSPSGRRGAALAPLAPDTHHYRAARADLLRRLGRAAESAARIAHPVGRRCG